MAEGVHLAGLPWPLAGLALGLLLAAVVGMTLTALRLARAHRARRQAEGLLQPLIDGAVDEALLVLDPDGRVAQWNAGAQRLHGYAAGEIVGRHYGCLFTPGDRSAKLPQNMLEIAARHGRYSVNGERVRKDGRHFFADVGMQALRDPSGRLLGFASIERDISEQLAQQRALTEARAALAQAQRLAALGRVSDGIAHDFNNVVHVIRTCVEALQRRLGPEPGVADFLQMIHRNAERAARLSQHLLTLARRTPITPALTNVNEVVGEVVELLRQTLSEDIVLDYSPDEGLSWTTVDRNELEAALLNLAADARDAMPRGGRLSIRTAGEVAESEGQEGPRYFVLISLSDTRAAQARALPRAAPAASADETARAAAGGRDSFVRGFLEQSGGRLRVDSQPERGTTVRLYLPCRAG